MTNHWGTAPGYWLQAGAALVAVLPGPPRENQPLFDAGLRPVLQSRWAPGGAWITRIVRVFGRGESSVAERLASAERGLPAEVRLGYQATFPEVLVKLRARAQHAERLDEAADAVQNALGHAAYALGADRLPTVVGRAVAQRGLRLTSAESCTAGLVAKLLTDEPGSSAWLDRAFVVYTNAAKRQLLGVPANLLASHGAVSEPVAAAMLRGALARADATVGVALSGVAGPGGGSDAKPVGTICLAWGDAAGVETTTLRLRWDRERNRELAAWAALSRLLRWLA